MTETLCEACNRPSDKTEEVISYHGVRIHVRCMPKHWKKDYIEVIALDRKFGAG